MLEIKPVTLEGKAVRLEPLQSDHLPDLLEAAQDDEIWTYLPVGRPHTLAEIQKWFNTAMEAKEAENQLPFAIVDLATVRAIGSTRYMAISKPDRSLEIGHSWLARDYWRTAINTESKYLLLRHAFETLDCIRVWFKSDSRNFNSHRAIERIGGKREGVLRKHMIVKNDYQRDSVIYSILDHEWPGVKAKLEKRLLGPVTK